MKLPHQLLWYLVLALTLALVFAMYTRPDFMLTMANQVWGCF